MRIRQSRYCVLEGYEKRPEAHHAGSGLQVAKNRLDTTHSYAGKRLGQGTHLSRSAERRSRAMELDCAQLARLQGSAAQCKL